MVATPDIFSKQFIKIGKANLDQFRNSTIKIYGEFLEFVETIDVDNMIDRKIRRANEVFFKKMYEIVETVISDIDNHGTAEISVPKVPVFHINNFNNFIGTADDIVDVLGSIIISVKEKFPQSINLLSFSDRRTFEDGLSAYTQILNAKADERLAEAKERVNIADAKVKDAISAEDTAETAEDLKTANRYWTEKTKAHRNGRFLYQGCFVVTLFLGLAYLFVFAPHIGDLPTDRFAGQKVSPYDFAIYIRNFVVPTLAVAWLLRLLSRQFITHLLLEEDARLRQVLIVTFLALQRNPDAEIDAKERAHMLEAVSARCR